MYSSSSKLHSYASVERFGDGDQPPAVPLTSSRPRSQRPRSRRVLYPPGARKILPKEESDPAKRWLLLLSALLFLQIYMEEGLCETQQSSQETSCSYGEAATERPLTWGSSEIDVAQCWGLNGHVSARAYCTEWEGVSETRGKCDICVWMQNRMLRNSWWAFPENPTRACGNVHMHTKREKKAVLQERAAWLNKPVWAVLDFPHSLKSGHLSAARVETLWL